jgi:hypothetical protein
MSSIWLSLVLLLLQAPATPQAPPQTRPEERGSINGFVVKMGTNEPLGKATVVLNGAEGGRSSQTFTASTSTDGRFTLGNVPPGKYRLSATRNGYIRYEFGARGPNRPGLQITIAAGQRMTQVVLPLTPAATITGRVFDRDGEPLAYVVVQALKYSYQDGQRVLNTVQTAATNDLGEYRLFWLNPGQYFVATTYEASPLSRAMARGEAGRGILIGPRGRGNVGVETARAEEDETQIPIYYPGTTDPQGAAPINLAAGVVFSGVDLTVTAVRTFRVRGQVINGSTGQPARNVNVVLEPRERKGFGAPILRSRGNLDNQGSFEIAGIVPGSYDLVAILNDRNNRMSARVPVEIGGSDVQNVSVVLTTGFPVSGHLAVEGVAQDVTRLRVTLRPSPGGAQFGGALPAAPVKADGTFSMPQVGQDAYRVNVTGMPRNFYLKSARLGATDVLQQDLRFDRPPTIPLEIVISSNTGTVNGTVLNERQEPSVNCIVVLVPSVERRFRGDLYKSASTDALGRVHLEGVPPGDYKIFAWEDVESGAWQDPDFMRQNEERGRPVRVTENSQTDIELRVIAPQ